MRVVLETLGGAIAGALIFAIFHGAEFLVEWYAGALPLAEASASNMLRHFLTWAGVFGAIGTVGAVTVYSVYSLISDLWKAR
jgi:hypothetical protein